MLVLLIRHAHAGERDPERWPDDRQRPLSDKGREIQERVARALEQLGLLPDLVLTSPWTRAAQSAEILVKTLRLKRPPVPCTALAARPDLIRLADYLGKVDTHLIAALVGHSPWLEELGALLLGGSTVSVRIDWPKSGVLAIDIDAVAPATGTLRFFLRPEMLKRM